jgi:hypothetical protein
MSVTWTKDFVENCGWRHETQCHPEGIWFYVLEYSSGVCTVGIAKDAGDFDILDTFSLKEAQACVKCLADALGGF